MKRKGEKERKMHASERKKLERKRGGGAENELVRELQ
jgi:hypothetical protein